MHVQTRDREKRKCSDGDAGAHKTRASRLLLLPVRYVTLFFLIRIRYSV